MNIKYSLEAIPLCRAGFFDGWFGRCETRRYVSKKFQKEENYFIVRRGNAIRLANSTDAYNRETARSLVNLAYKSLESFAEEYCGLPFKIKLEADH